MSSSLTLHFDGDIVSNHFVSARTLGRSLVHTQNAVDRAFLDLKYGNLWKHARMKADDYHAADFIALYPEEGGFVQKLLSDSGKAIVDRISSALGPAMDRVLQEGDEVSDSLQQQVTNRKNQIEKGLIEPSTFQHIVENPGQHVVRSYADRSINREIDQVLSMIRSRNSGDSVLEITTEGSRTENYQFNRFRSERFHSIISKRQVGEPMPSYSLKVKRTEISCILGYPLCPRSFVRPSLAASLSLTTWEGRQTSTTRQPSIEHKGTSMIRMSRGKAEVSLPPRKSLPLWSDLLEFADFF